MVINPNVDTDVDPALYRAQLMETIHIFMGNAKAMQYKNDEKMRENLMFACMLTIALKIDKVFAENLVDFEDAEANIRSYSVIELVDRKSVV